MLLGDKGYDGDWFRAALESRGITACIPLRTVRPHLHVRNHRGRNRLLLAVIIES